VVAAMVATVAVTMEVVVMEATVAVTMVVAATVAMVAMVKMFITDIIKMNFLNYCIKISVYEDKMLCLLRKIQIHSNISCCVLYWILNINKSQNIFG
jgi:hypothetical protein